MDGLRRASSIRNFVGGKRRGARMILARRNGEIREPNLASHGKHTGLVFIFYWKGDTLGYCRRIVSISALSMHGRCWKSRELAESRYFGKSHKSTSVSDRFKRTRCFFLIHRGTKAVALLIFPITIAITAIIAAVTYYYGYYAGANVRVAASIR
ncbi:hypothetical protein PUN28_018831 [Cardiocondyla obscurior]|uniref:Uncharacterized protein n=1 Tax=Cardiocondyla obscurior TaxID=286306 RepID=A0AAW2EC96_9HYME